MAYKQENQQSTETNREITELMELADRHIKAANWFLQRFSVATSQQNMQNHQ